MLGEGQEGKEGKEGKEGYWFYVVEAYVGEGLDGLGEGIGKIRLGVGSGMKDKWMEGVSSFCGDDSLA